MLASGRRLPHYEWFGVFVLAGIVCLAWSFFVEENRRRRRLRMVGLLLLAAALPVQDLAVFLGGW